MYDGFGNLREKTGSKTYSAAFDPATNREVGLSYYANGNQLTDRAGVASLQYDVENRLVWGRNGWSSPGWWYGYDADNRRVYLSKWSYVNYDWSLNSEQLVYYGIGGQKMGTYTLTFSGSTMQLTATGYNVYFGSKLVRKIDSAGTAVSAQPDRLGSFGKFYPYGEARPGFEGTGTEKFATYYRDDDTGLDYAVNRYYNSVSGRFMSADLGPPDSVHPQSWNRFAYAWGDPSNMVDPDGMLPSFVPGSSSDQSFPEWYYWGSGPLVLGNGSSTVSRLGEVALAFDAYDDVLAGFIISDLLDVNAIDWGGLVGSLNADDPDQFIRTLQAVQTVQIVLRIGSIAIGNIAKKYGPAVALVVDEIWKRYRNSSVVVIADCPVHPIGGADHEAEKRVQGIGYGPTEPAAKDAAYNEAQMMVAVQYGAGYHAQHCNYKRVK